MDVAGRGSKTYIKVDSIEPPSEVDEDDTGRKKPYSEYALELNNLASHPEEDEHEQQLDVKVLPDEKDSSSSVATKGKCMAKCGWLFGVLTVMSVLIGVISVGVDWLWVHDMLMARKGLVFGPPSKGVIVALIIMASLGTVTYLGESADKIKKLCTGKEWFDEETEELASLFLEEVPEITLNMLLSMCREIPTSYFQMIKGLLVMLSSGVRLLKAFLTLMGCRKDKKSKKKLRCSGWLILMAACIYTFSASITVFVFTYNPPKGDTSYARFHVPKTVMAEHYNTDRYFPKAGVFFSHPSLDHCDHTHFPTRFREGSDHKNWFQVDEIYGFLNNGQSPVKASYSYDAKSGAFWVESESVELCYTVTFSDCSLVQTNVTDCDSFKQATILSFSFMQIPRTKTVVFGDIQFNATKSTADECHYLTTNPFGQLFDGEEYSGQLHYFRAAPFVDTSLPVQYIEPQYKFYHYPQDLVNVTEAWKTGHQKCTMTGAIAPNPNSKILSTCGNQQNITAI